MNKLQRRECSVKYHIPWNELPIIFWKFNGIVSMAAIDFWCFKTKQDRRKLSSIKYPTNHTWRRSVKNKLQGRLCHAQMLWISLRSFVQFRRLLSWHVSCIRLLEYQSRFLDIKPVWMPDCDIPDFDSIALFASCTRDACAEVGGIEVGWWWSFERVHKLVDYF